MAYLCKNRELRNEIKRFIGEYIENNQRVPSVRTVAEGVGMSRATAHRYILAMKESGELDEGLKSLVERLREDSVLVQMCGAISCGAPREFYSADSEYFTLPRSWVGGGSFFAVVAEGDSMIDAGIEEGDLVIVRREVTCRDGEIAVVLVEGSETTLKTFYRMEGEGRYRLHAENSSYTGEERDRIVESAEIQGVAVKVIKGLPRRGGRAEK